MSDYVSMKAKLLDLLNNHEFGEMILLCQKMESTQKNNSDFYYLWGVAAGRAQDHELANMMFYKSVKLDMSNMSAMMNYIVSCFPLGQAQNAINMMDISLEGLNEVDTEMILRNATEAITVGDINPEHLTVRLKEAIDYRQKKVKSSVDLVDYVYSIRPMLNHGNFLEDRHGPFFCSLSLKVNLEPVIKFIRKNYTIKLNEELYPEVVTLDTVTTQLLNVNILFDEINISALNEIEKYELVQSEQWFDLIGDLCLMYMKLRDYTSLKDIA